MQETASDIHAACAPAAAEVQVPAGLATAAELERDFTALLGDWYRRPKKVRVRNGQDKALSEEAAQTAALIAWPRYCQGELENPTAFLNRVHLNEFLALRDRERGKFDENEVEETCRPTVSSVPVKSRRGTVPLQSETDWSPPHDVDPFAFGVPHLHMVNDFCADAGAVLASTNRAALLDWILTLVADGSELGERAWSWADRDGRELEAALREHVLGAAALAAVTTKLARRGPEITSRTPHLACAYLLTLCVQRPNAALLRRALRRSFPADGTNTNDAHISRVARDLLAA